MVTVTVPRINTPYAVEHGVERWRKATDQLHVYQGGANGGLLLCMRRGQNPDKEMQWPLDVPTAQHLIALMQAALKPMENSPV